MIEARRSSRALPLPLPVVEVSDVTKRFGRLTVLEGVSFDVRAGRITAILGPNAAGKSTVIKTILGLVRPDVGRILIDGVAVNGMPASRTALGYMPQQAHFPDNLTGSEILALLSDLRSRPATDLELIRDLGLDREMTRPIRTLSGGTRQKLNAAMAFLFQPRLLILDEPTAGLDPFASAILKEKILRLRDLGASIILTSHVLADLEALVDDVVFLLEGRVMFKGSLHQLKESTGQDRLEPAVVRLMSGTR